LEFNIFLRILENIVM